MTPPGRLAAVGLVLVGAALLSLSVVVPREYEGPGVRTFGLFVALLGVAGVGGGALAAVDESGWAAIWVLQCAELASIAWLVFAIRYTGRGAILTRRVRSVLVGAYVLLWLPLAWSAAGGTADAVVVNLFSTATDLYGLAVTLVGATLVVQATYRHGVLDARGGATLAAVATGPWILTRVDRSALVGIPPSPAVWYGSGFAVLVCLLAVAVFHLDVFDSTAATQPLGRRALLSGAEDVVVVVDADDRIVTTNDAAERRLDVSPNVRGDDLADLLGVGAAALGDRRELELDTVDGTRQFDVQRVELGDDRGASLGHLVSLRDVTERERREQRLGVLNRVLRHNLRNDASVVVNYAEHVAENVADEDLAGAARRVAERGRTLASHGEKARRIESAMSDGTDREPVDVVPAVEAAAADVRAEYPDAAVAVDPPETARALALPSFEVAVEEVCENAVVHGSTDEEADSEDGPHVDIGVERGPETVAVVVGDDGPGIPDHELEAVAAGEETALEHGSGVGLWLVQWIVERSGGTVSYADRDGGGTVVTITLDAAEAATEDGDDGSDES